MFFPWYLNIYFLNKLHWQLFYFKKIYQGICFFITECIILLIVYIERLILPFHIFFNLILTLKNFVIRLTWPKAGFLVILLFFIDNQILQLNSKVRLFISFTSFYIKIFIPSFKQGTITSFEFTRTLKFF